AFAMLLMGFVLLRKYPIKKPNREYMKMYLKFATPLMVPVVFTLITLNIDKVMLGYFWSSVEVGHYFAVQRITTMILMISGAVGIVLFPTVSSFHSRYKHERKKRNRAIITVTQSSERYSSMVTIPLVFIIIVFTVPIIDIVLNSAFRPATLSLQVLAIYTYVLTLGMPYRFLILGMDKPALFAKVLVIGGVVNIVLNFLLIPENGLLSRFDINGPSGAAIAALISAIVLLVGFHNHSRKLMRHRLLQRKIFKHIVAGLLMGVLIWKLSTFIEPLRWFYLVGLSFAGLGIYVGILWCIREFRKADFTFFVDTINPMNMARYIKTEIKEKP
ncbi:MAG: polysaccharide biosynthesis protein, partial [Thermoplasmata archaeon]|nr:polysaccharide biosynthesis protein [Thermoplasmata archaeon]